MRPAPVPRPVDGCGGHLRCEMRQADRTGVLRRRRGRVADHVQAEPVGCSGMHDATRSLIRELSPGQVWAPICTARVGERLAYHGRSPSGERELVSSAAGGFRR